MKFRYIILLIASVLMLGSCAKEDDIEEIFQGKTWYITGGEINGKPFASEDIKQLYSQKDIYYISFAAKSFHGVLAPKSSLSGQWSANGKSNAFHFVISNAEATNETALSQNVYTIIKNASRYEGDINVLKIKSDNNNYIRLSVKK